MHDRQRLARQVYVVGVNPGKERVVIVAGHPGGLGVVNDYKVEPPVQVEKRQRSQAGEVIDEEEPAAQAQIRLEKQGQEAVKGNVSVDLPLGKLRQGRADSDAVAGVVEQEVVPRTVGEARPHLVIPCLRVLNRHELVQLVVEVRRR